MPVVALGSCVGGLEAIRSILAKLPSNCGMALVVIQHLDPARRSILRGLRSNVIPFPVLEISNGIALQPNHVYIVPPNKKASIHNGTLSLRPITGRDTHQPIDDFMTDLAATRGDKAIGAVLSGVGSDGTSGLAAIKAAGGITFAQDPKTAHRPAMPLSAIKAGNVDFVLSPAHIAVELERLARYSYKPAGRHVHPGLVETHVLLGESESTVRALLEASPQAIFAVNAAGTIIWVNGTAAKIFGYESQELPGQPLDLLVPEPYRNRHTAHHENFLANPQTRSMGMGLEFQARHKNGTLFPMEIGLSFIETQTGVLGLAFVNDITVQKTLNQSLLQRERQLAALFDSSPDAHARFDSNLRVTHANTAFGKAMGVQAETLIDKTVRQLPISEGNKQIAGTLINKVFRTGHSQRYEFSMVTAEDVTQYEVRYVPELSIDGSVAAVLGIGRDVTELKTLNQSIRQRESELAALFDSSPDAHLRFDSSLRVTHANAAYAKVTQIPAREIIGKTGRELPLPQGDVRVVDRLIKNVFRTGRPNQVELSGPSAEGVTQEVRFVPEFSPDGSVAAVLAIGRDVTDRKRVEQVLRQREQEMATLFDNSPDVIMRVDRKLRSLYVNAAWERVTGISRKTALGKTILKLGLPPIAVKLKQRAVREVLKTESPKAVEFKYPLATGPVDFEVRHIPEFDNGTVSSVLMIGRDISEQKRLQKLAAASERDIRALSASLLNAQEQERRRMAREIHDSVCQHLGVLAAEIGGIAAQLPFPSPAGRQLQAAQKRALQAAEEARQIARRLHPAILEDLGLPKALQNLCHEFRQREGIAVKLQVPKTIPDTPLDAVTCVYRIAQEALSNIAKHAHAKNVWVRLNGTRNLRLSIHDDGIGFDPDEVRGAGGLGLVSMQERARIAGGKVSIQGRPGHGTRVDLVAPIRGATRAKSAHSAGG